MTRSRENPNPRHRDECLTPDIATCGPAAPQRILDSGETIQLKRRSSGARARSYGSRKRQVETGSVALPPSSFFSTEAQRLFCYLLCLGSLQKLTSRIATAKIRRPRRSSRLENLDLRSPSTRMRRFRTRTPAANGAKRREPFACSGKDRRRASVCIAAPATEHVMSVHLQLFQ